MSYTAAFMTRHRVVPLEIGPALVVVGVDHAPSAHLKRVLQSYHGCPVKFRTLRPDRVTILMQRSLHRDRGGTRANHTGGRTRIDAGTTGESTGGVNLVNAIVNDAVAHRASDVHIESFAGHAGIRYRVDGHLHTPDADASSLSLGEFRSVAARAKVLAGVDATERRRPQDGSFTAVTVAGTVDVRFSSSATVDGESIVLRLFRRHQDEFTLGTLGMSDSMVAVARRHAERRSGMIVVCGPTGSGKTTTLHALLRSIAGAHRKIIAVEDPVEYRVPEVQQIQTDARSGLSFAVLLRHVLRQDPDVIMVGEIRDEETAGLAVRAALTGHLVLSTVHAPGAATVRRRLEDLGVSNRLLATISPCTIGQRLVRRACTCCGGAGCEACGGIGYWGRVGLFELRAPGVDRDMRAEGSRLVSLGVTTAHEVARELAP